MATGDRIYIGGGEGATTSTPPEDNSVMTSEGWTKLDLGDQASIADAETEAGLRGGVINGMHYKDTAEGFNVTRVAGEWRAFRPPKVTTFWAGSADYVFTPDPLAIATKVELQAGGGSSGKTWDSKTGHECAVSTGGNGGNFLAVMITSKITSPQTVKVPRSTPKQTSYNWNGNNGGTCNFGTISAQGGTGGRVNRGDHNVLVKRALSQSPNSGTSIVGLTSHILMDVRGQVGTSPYIGYYNVRGGIEGGHGGNSHWGSGGRSNVAAYHGTRKNSIDTIAEPDTGFGGGGAGVAASRGAKVGGAGGKGHAIITEYF